MRSRALALALTITCSLSAAGAAQDDPPWRVRDFATDGTGQVWAVADHSDPENSDGSHTPFDQLAALAPGSPRQDAWQPHPQPDLPTGALPEALAVLATGHVVCLWQNRLEARLTLHRDGKDTPWCSLEHRLTGPSLLPLPDGGLAIVENGPSLVRISATGTATVTTLPETVLTKAQPQRFRAAPMPPHPGSRQLVDPSLAATLHPAVHAVVCGDGSLCLWSHGPKAKNVDYQQIEGLARWPADGSPPVLVGSFPAGTEFSAVVADGPDHLYAVQAGTGLLRLHWPDGKAEPTTATGPGFARIEHLAMLNGRPHFVTSPLPPERVYKFLLSRPDKDTPLLQFQRFHDPAARSGTLWRLDPSGPPVPLIQGLDGSPMEFQSLNPRVAPWQRTLIATGRGILVGAAHGLPWWLPAAPGSTPYMLDHAQGFNLVHLAGATPQGKDRFLVRATDNTFSRFALPDDKPRPPSTRIATLLVRSAIVQDSRQHLWALRINEADLAEWDGHIWHSHGRPHEIEGIAELEFTADHHDHGWLVPNDSGRTAVLDFATVTWKVFDTLEHAVAEKLVPGDHLFMRTEVSRTVVSHANGGKGFISGGNVLHVFDQGRWLQIPMKDVSGNDGLYQLAPFFDDKGTFTIREENSLKDYHFRSTGAWDKTDAPEDSWKTAVHFNLQAQPPPAGCDLPHLFSTAYDPQGTAWITTQEGELWRWHDNLGLSFSDKYGGHLMPPRAAINEVLLDAAHNACLRHRPPPLESVPVRYDIVFATPAPASVPPATVTDITPERATVHFPDLEGVWHRFRLDNQPWQPLGQRPHLFLSGLPPGPRQLLVESFGSDLHPLGKSQSLAFTIPAGPAKDLSKLLALLSSPDLAAREAAVHELEAQGPAILPQLQKLLSDPATDSTTQWWLKAVIQNIEAKATK